MAITLFDADQAYYAHLPARPISFGSDSRMDMSQNEHALQECLMFVNTVRQGEVLLFNEFGTRLHDRVFDQNDRVVWMAIDTHIRATTNDWEPRVEIRNVEVKRDDVDPYKASVLITWRALPSSTLMSTKIGLPYGEVTRV